MTDLVTSALLARSGLWGSTYLAPTSTAVVGSALRRSALLNNALATSALAGSYYPGYAGWGGYYGYRYPSYGLGYSGLYGGLGYSGLYGSAYRGYGAWPYYSGLGLGNSLAVSGALARSVAIRNSLYPGLYKSTVVDRTEENANNEE